MMNNGTFKRILAVLLTVVSLSAIICSTAISSSASGTITVVLNDNGQIAFTTARLNLRRSATTSSGIITVLPKGMTVYIKSTSGNWAYVETYPQGNKRTGWVSRSYLDTYYKLGAYYAVEATAGLNVRTGASTSSARLGTLRYGARVYVFGAVGNEWSLIRYNGRNAYVATKYLRLVG